MPPPHLPPPAARRALRTLGADMRAARLRRRLPMEVVAERAGTTRQTVARIERGDPSVAAGILAAVLQALGLVERLGTVADPAADGVGLDIAREDLPRRAYPPRRRGERGDG